MTLLQQSPGGGVGGGVHPAAVGGSGKGGEQSESVLEFSNLDAPASSDEDREEQKRNLLTKQTFDVTSLENSLCSDEMRGVNDILDDFEKRKRGLAADVGRDMRTKLANAMTDAEKQKVEFNCSSFIEDRFISRASYGCSCLQIMMEYAGNLQKFTDALEKQKQQQLEDLRRRLLEKRRQKKKELHKQQVRSSALT